MAQQETFELILVEFSRLVEPVAEASEEGLEGMRRFALRAGLDIDRLLKDMALDSVRNTAMTIKSLYATLRPIAEDGEVDASQITALLPEIPRMIDTIAQLDDLEFNDDAPAQFQDMGHILLDYLIILYLRDYHPALHSLLLLLGVIDDGQRADQIHARIEYTNLGGIFKDVGAVAEDVYGWSTDDFNASRVLVRLQGVLWFLGFAANFRQSDSSTDLPDVDQDASQVVSQLQMPILQIDRDEGLAEFGVSIVPLKASGGSAPGLGLVPFGAVGASEEIALDDQWSVTIAVSAEALVPWGVALRSEAILITSVADSVSPLTANLSFAIERGTASDEKEILFGDPDGLRLELGTIGLKLGFGFDSGKDPNIFVEIPVKGLSLVIDTSDSDGFLRNILPQGGIMAEFDLSLGISSRDGVYFGGSGGLEVSVPTHLTLGSIDLQALTLSAKLKDDGIPISAGATVSANLGPLSTAVENIGLSVTLGFADNNSGNLGPLDLSLGFKPPNGVGLAIDAAVVKGGGYLYFDFDKEEYAGVLELDLNGIVSVKVIGLIATKMPDGSKGFSLLMIITAEFGSPIQLGLGFTLSGVGGLLGLNRTMRLEVIATGVRDGGINSIMFPQNVVANAPRIISDLKKYFPVEEGVFLIGPMAKIGWGTPNLVTVSLGVIIDIDTNTSSVGGIAILGVLKVALPDEEHPEILIQVNFMGAIEPDKKRLWFFASIYDSRVLFITLEGQMGLAVGWGNDPNFLISIGGFHPAFNPPPLPFGSINRISISILNERFARIRVEGYFAVTSNSVQFGASVEMFFGLSEFKIDGHLAFDALFRFSPFYFVISISASLSVKVFGVGLFSVRFRGSLEGPTPWHVEGTGSISILFFHIDVDFSHTWGTHEDTVLPPISVMPLLVAEYQKLENWQAVLPDNNQLLVSLRSFDQGATDLILHPVGSLKVSQRTVPLGVTIDKIGNQKPSDANRFSVTVNTTGMGAKGDVEESFAVGQFFAKSDNELLSAKSFEPMKGGVELSVVGEQYHAPVAVKRVVRYEQIIIDTHFKRFVKPLYTLFGSLFSLFLGGNATSKSVLSKKRREQLKPFSDKIKVGSALFAVASNEDNSPFSENAVSFTSQVQAMDYLQQQVAGDANLANQLHVIPQTELQRAA